MSNFRQQENSLDSNKALKRKLALERGRRVKLARNLSNLTRKDMFQRYGINPNTIHAWEKGANCLTEKNACKLFEAFRQEGLSITKEWLLYGEDPSFGHGPTLDEKNQELQDILNIRRDLKIFNEVNYFRQNNANSISTMITDEALSPLFCRGDYVGGVYLSRQDLKMLVGEFCIILTEDKQILTRKIFNYQAEDIFIIGGINPFAKLNGPDCIPCRIQAAAQITRHWHLGKMLED